MCTAPAITTYQARIDPRMDAQKWLSSEQWWGQRFREKEDFVPTGTFHSHGLERAFAVFTVWSDNGLTLILLFSAGTKVSPGSYHPLVICVAWRNSGKVQEKGGGIVAASCWPAHWPIVAAIFLKLSHHNYFGNILFPSWIWYSIYWPTLTASMHSAFWLLDIAAYF